MQRSRKTTSSGTKASCTSSRHLAFGSAFMLADLMLKSIHRPHHRVVCAQLRAAREAAGWTQVRFAKRLKTTQAWVSSVETGLTRLDLVQVWEWCRACNASLPDLVDAINAGFAALPAARRAPAQRKTKATTKGTGNPPTTEAVAGDAVAVPQAKRSPRSKRSPKPE